MDKNLQKQTQEIRALKDEVLETTHKISVIADNVKEPVAQILTFMIQKELHDERDKTALAARTKGSVSEYQTALISPIVRRTSYLMNYLCINQLFQNNNDIPKAAAGAALSVNILGGTFLSVLEQIISGLVGNNPTQKGESDETTAIGAGLKALHPTLAANKFLYDQISKRFNLNITDKINMSLPSIPSLNLNELGEK